ncbi:MAG: hypothetical protein HC908_17155 [Calothrix sp. SM1_7_51]|nr:hypothetical protein [Calothrix sp. SM1_7_51]
MTYQNPKPCDKDFTDFLEFSVHLFLLEPNGGNFGWRKMHILSALLIIQLQMSPDTSRQKLILLNINE